MGNEQGKSDGSLPSGMQAMDQKLQRRFAKGVQYDMKILIKGDRNTGKTCLFKRLQGGGFVEDYIPTKEIQIASIQWNYRATDDVVKVDIWDIVDKGRSKKKAGGGLKLSNEGQDASTVDGVVALDAQFLNIYQRAHGVVMLMDVTKQWTWQYVQRELPCIPPHIPILVLANFKDMAEHQVVVEEEIQYFIDALKKEDASRAEIRYAESSMKNGFGLRYLYKFLNVPFLRLQRDTLLQQLEINKQDENTTLEELAFMLETEEQNYDKFLVMLENRKRQSRAGGLTPDSESAPTASPPTPTNTPRNSKPKEAETAAKEPQVELPQPGATPPSSSEQQPKKSFGSRLLARFRSKDAQSSASKPKESPPTPHHSESSIPGVKSIVKPVNVDEFVPEETLDASFFGGGDQEDDDDDDDNDEEKPKLAADEESSDEGNPMVAGDEDIDFKDAGLVTAAVGGDLEVSSDEDKGPVVAVNEDVTSRNGPVKKAAAAAAAAPKEKKKKKKKEIVVVVTSSSEDLNQPTVAVDEDVGDVGLDLEEEEVDEEVKKKREKEKAEAAALDLGIGSGPLPSGLDAWLESMSGAPPPNLPDPMVLIPAVSEEKSVKKKSGDSPEKKRKHKKHRHREEKKSEGDEEKKKKKKKHRPKKEKGEGGNDYEIV
eukprot:m.189838 g.189838  ORF g.189838 m.189838 type:complete len:655 (+) comp39424_c0_seq1:313-2277(+)